MTFAIIEFKISETASFGKGVKGAYFWLTINNGDDSVGYHNPIAKALEFYMGRST